MSHSVLDAEKRGDPAQIPQTKLVIPPFHNSRLFAHNNKPVRLRLLFHSATFFPHRPKARGITRTVMFHYCY